MDIVKTIADWPVIVQGTIGSGLFWVILEVGQRIVRLLAARLSADKNTANWFALAAHEASPQIIEGPRFFCFYGAIHYIVKALIVVILSLAVSPLIDVFSSVGYLIATYFLFRALAYVPHTSSFGGLPERRRRYMESIDQLRTQPTPHEASTKSAK